VEWEGGCIHKGEERRGIDREGERERKGVSGQKVNIGIV
jgi:hypothetical protein